MEAAYFVATVLVVAAPVLGLVVALFTFLRSRSA
jgi:hypothetical protein